MKKILMTQRISRDPDRREVRDCLDVTWARFMERLGFLPVLLPSEYDVRKFLREMPVKGVILTGGNDLACVSPNDLSVRRDSLEKKVIGCAIRRDIPVLGVCRGMQVIADFFGARIVPVQSHVAVKHRLAVSPASRYHRFLSNIRRVNSFHRYAVDPHLCRGLMVSAVGSDGVVEAIEHVKHRIFGQMWHPERTEPFSALEVSLIRAFFGR